MDDEAGMLAASLAAVERSRRPKTPKLSARPELRDVVVAKLVLQWSPQQIAPTERVCRRVHERLNELPLELRRTLTWDQGTEMSGHQQFTLDSGIPVFFCDPLSPWQRPTNENTNGLLRGYFPKGEDLGHVTSADLERAEFELNNRPRRILNWLSPTQRLSQLCALTP